MLTAQELEKIPNQLRANVLKMVNRAGAGHVAGPLSSAEIFTLLYFGEEVRKQADNPWWEERDRVVLSAGHYCPIQYAALAKAGYFPREELSSFMEAGSRLPGHPEYRRAPGIEATTGSLGQGVSVAVGMAMAIKLKYGERAREKTPRVYCVLSDGELQEGEIWEAFNTAVRRQLDNLTFILDRNHIQIERYISEVATMGAVEGRLEAFGLNTYKCDGNDLRGLEKTFKLARKVQGGPVAIVAETVAGKGVSFMEGKPEWHDRVPTEKELEKALRELGENNEE
ncbi:MAG: transketolase [bacterium]